VPWIAWFGYRLFDALQLDDQDLASEAFWLLLIVPIGAPIVMTAVLWVIAGFRKREPASTANDDNNPLARTKHYYAIIDRAVSQLDPMRILKKLWYGQYSLVVTFWGFYVGGYVLVVLVCLMIFYQSEGAQPARMFNFVAPILYLFVASVGVWISADRAQSRVGAWAARACVLLFGLGAIQNVYRYNLPELLNNLTAR
jgi:hypothetical protein